MCDIIHPSVEGSRPVVAVKLITEEVASVSEIHATIDANCDLITSVIFNKNSTHLGIFVTISREV